MRHFYLTTFVAFAIWKTVSLTLHFFSESPWGGPLVADPDRLLPDALLLEWGLLALTCMVASLVDHVIRRDALRHFWRQTFLVLACLYCAFSQIDQEVVRWLGQHATLSYLRNYAGVPDPVLMTRIFSSDLVWTGASAFLIIVTPVPALVAWRRHGQSDHRLPLRALAIFVCFAFLASTAHQWFRPSEKRWRRIRPAAVTILHDGFLSLSGQERPRHPSTAEADLLAYVEHRELPSTPKEGPSLAYPLWRDSNLGDISLEAFRALPLEDRPDIVLVVFETMRAWNTGLVPHPSLQIGTPKLNARLNQEGTYYPYAHSGGFPSVEGCMGIHLGIWSHFRKIIFSDFTHIRSRAFPEILRDAGYDTYALLGADPSFDNFTPWIQRWYDTWEYDPAVHHDGPLVDRFIDVYDAYTGNAPRMMMLWTATTHPPYDLPTSENIPPAPTSEERFDQAIVYADTHIARLIDHLHAQDAWSRTIVIVVGDHAQPTPHQWKASDAIGPLNPGHTWTVLGFLGGWPGLPNRGRQTVDVSHIDIAPTLLSMLNLRAHNHFMGRDLFRASDDTQEVPIVAFRQGDLVWQRGDQRVQFRLDSDLVRRIRFDRENPLSYGALDGGTWHTDDVLPDDMPLARWQDVIRLYGKLLDDDRLMPASFESAGVTETSRAFR